MKNILRFGLAALAMLALAAPAHADTVPGWYLAPGAVLHMPMDADSKKSANGVTDKVKFDNGWGILGAVGYAWPSGIRLEEELSFMRANVDRINGNSGSGRVNDLGIMTNLLYDFQTGTRWTPYVGGGLGINATSVDHIGNLTGGGQVNDSGAEFAYQGIVGTAYELADHWSATVDYRYIGTTSPRLKVTTGGTAELENSSHNVVIGLRYTMHAPQPAPAPLQEVEATPPLPQPAPARAPVVEPVPQSYMVFFDFDRSIITPEAERIIAAAAEDFKTNGYARLIVTGHTDTMGSDPYNKGLSERRAAVVKKRLMELGVDVASIDASGVGKKGQLVPTANGVREAQNRRAEIVLSKGQ